MQTRKRVAIALTIALAVRATAYEIPVHERMTERAAERALRDVPLQSLLGIERDATAGGRTPQFWIIKGSEEEDHVLQSFPFARSLHHFYDPVHGAPLTVGVWPLCTSWLAFYGFPPIATVRADQWGLDPQLLNSWNLPVARRAQYDAVLGPNPGTRDVNLKNLFLSLGHMVHLVQDMAQPEHTRNDQHRFAFGAQQPSLYEHWTLISLLGDNDAGIPPIENADAFFDGYPSVRLPTFRDYFHNAAGQGLADYSNRNFVTQETNYDDERSLRKCFHYSEPTLDDPNTSLTVREVRSGAIGPDGDEYCCEEFTEWTYVSRPDDRVQNARDVDAYHTLYSSLDYETRRYTADRQVFSLSPSSFHTRAALLMPRAVGYSAGFIEHFFRGRLDVRWEPGAPGQSLVITNRSDDAIGADAEITAVMRATPEYFRRDTSDDTALIFRGKMADLVPAFNGIPAGGSVTIPHVQPPADLRIGDVLPSFETRIAIRGTLGSEADAVVTHVRPPGGSVGRKIVNFDDWIPAGVQPPYFDNAYAISAGDLYGVMGGTLLWAPSSYVDSAVYAGYGYANKATFWWKSPVEKPEFVLMNLEHPASFRIDISPHRSYDASVFQTVELGPWQRVVIKLPESGVARFTVRQAAGKVTPFYIDDVSWE